MSTPNSKNVDEIWKNFKGKKVSISLAINKLFPFLYILRDAEIISQEVFDNCKMEANSNINEAIYNVLENLEFNELAYRKLFCEENLTEYQGLQPIYKSLNNELQHAENKSVSELTSNSVSSTTNELLQHGENRPASEPRSNPESCTGKECVPAVSHGPVRHRFIALNKGRRVQRKKKNQNSNYESNKLRVCCGKAKGVLFKNILAKGVSNKCIKDNQGRWFTPREFECKGGCESRKYWKQSIFSNGVPLKKLIEDGYLPYPRQIHPRRNKKKNAPRSLSQFRSPGIPVQCGDLTGVLYKHRFLAGPLKKSIRLAERWCTPEEFVEMNDEITDGSWEMDIRSEGKPLRDLIENGSLENHQEDCSCYTCKGNKGAGNDENDDICAICNQEGFLTCCDSCPRSFHNVCHIPNIDTTEGMKWICIYCKSKSQFSANPTTYTEQFVLQRRMVKHQVNCAFLFLKTCSQDSSVFAEKPIKVVKKKLQQEKYQNVGCFIHDMREIFNSFQKNDQDTKIQEMGQKLQDEFEKNFREVFAIKFPVLEAEKI